MRSPRPPHPNPSGLCGHRPGRRCAQPGYPDRKPARRCRSG
jgi:hypothetical protein